MAEADAEYGHVLCEDFLNCLDRVVARFWIAGAIGQEHTVGFQCQRVHRGGDCRQHGDLATALGQHAQDVVLNTVVVGDNMKLRVGLRGIAGTERPHGLIPVVGFFARHDPGQIKTRHVRRGIRQVARARNIFCTVFADQDATVLRALLARQACQAARIDVGNGYDTIAMQIFRQCFLHPPVGGERRQITNDETRGVTPVRFDILTIGTGIADMRVSQGHHLPHVRGVGENLLIARHRRVEHHLADRVPGRPDRNAFEYRPVGKNQQGRRGDGV